MSICFVTQKTRLQVQSNALDAQGKHIAQLAADGKPVTRYRNIAHGIVQLFRDEGIRGGFRGIFPKLVSRGPLSAASSIMYEVVLYISRMMNKYIYNCR
jgi:hypothetical protein